MARRKDFSELTRVQIPAALHLMRMGYTYLPRNGKEIAERDPDTNIVVDSPDDVTVDKDPSHRGQGPRNDRDDRL